MLDSFRVIVVTLCNAGRLVTMGFGASHFSHVFIDEAGYAMEPEALIPISGKNIFSCSDWQTHRYGM
jgi:helicase MOV-10